jgi:acetyl-CoA carboxylase carboxyltransferase component
MERNQTAGIARITAILDPGSFAEVGAYVGKNPDGTDLTGIVCGYGSIAGRLVYVFSQDPDRKLGAMDSLQAAKIERLYQMALSNGAPVIGIFDSVGAPVEEGAQALAAYGRVMRCVTRASGVIPQIACIAGVCAGMSATIAAMFDFTVMINGKSRYCVTSPFVLEDEVASDEIGLASLVAENDADAAEKVRALLAMIPSNNADGTETVQSMDDLNRTVARTQGKDLITAIADDGRFLALQEAYGREMIIGFASIGYYVCGIIANDPTVEQGAISPDGARKAARFLSFCDCFDIPVLTLVDSIGVAKTVAAERDPAASALARLAQAYATSRNAKVTVVSGKAYGAALTLMGSHSVGADTVLAVEEACISTMSPESAVAFLWNDRITPEVSRASLEEKWRTEQAAPTVAAAQGVVDDIVPATELRARICAAFYMLARKSTLAIERRHANLPL